MQQPANNITFIEKLESCWQRDNFVCVGLDADYDQLPEVIKADRSVEDALFHFNREIIDATHDLVCAYKPNAAFYEAQGEAGLRALISTVCYIHETFPHIPTILDAKRADIGSTNIGYAQSAFDVIGVDAMTVHPYLGREALAPFLARKEKGIIVLAKTSNAGSGEFQDLSVGPDHEPLYMVVARHVAQEWNGNGNCALVVGATYPEELRRVRALVGDMPILIPGIGTQGGEVVATVKAGKDSRGWGMIISSSRGIIFASRGSDFATAARTAAGELRAEINRYR
ncbi:MAG TPA: orotidine-5'-phosphate decarboxylase [Ktedonobacteraceae bacterium]|nr:orotidine-5'-phosphate decarboxylase [Ktedonobacteraceae bacterium]